MIPDCTARDFLTFGYAATSITQRGILRRVTDYSLACRMWMDAFAGTPDAQHMDHVRCADLSRMTATLVFLAFPELRDSEALVRAA